MRLATVDFVSGPEAVVEIERMWVRTAALVPGLDDMLDVLPRLDDLRGAIEGADVASLANAGDAVSEEARLHAPVMRPGKVLAIGLNYVDHIKEVGAETPPQPLMFPKLSSSVTGPYDDVVLDDSLTVKGDYEVELVAVIGRSVRDVAVEDALSAVAGYAVGNDVSSRDLQMSESQWSRSKSFDGFCPFGPWITTADEVPDPQRLALGSWVNGEPRQSSNTELMLFGVAELVAHLSRGTTLHPGDIILTGTPPGVAMGMPDQPWLRPGDVVRCEVEGLGHIENRMVAPGEARG